MTFTDFNLAGDVLSVSSHVQSYLGHWITDQLTDDEDIYRRMLYVQANILLWKFISCRESVMVTLFTTYRTLMYTAHIWSRYKKKQALWACKWQMMP